MDAALAQEMMGRLVGWIDMCVVMAAAELGLADHLTQEVPRRAKDVAGELGLDERATERILRSLTASGVTSVRPDGTFTLGPAGPLLVSDTPGSLRSALRMFGGPVGRAAHSGVLAVRSGRPAFDEVFGMPGWEYLAGHPDEGAVFNAAMVDVGTALGGPAVAAYDFGWARTLVDVGGGRGGLTVQALAANSNLAGVVFDQPHVIAETVAEIERAGLTGRCRAEGGSFFETVPSGDCIVMRWIIHDWNDEESLTILRRCREAIEPGGRLLLFEVVMPEGDGPHFAKSFDWVMLACISGNERSEAAYADLLAGAGFRLERVIPSPTPMSVIEALPV
jgi:hypothetical protein